jgi:nucleoside-diphosphate-sugar epimerase
LPEGKTPVLLTGATGFIGTHLQARLRSNYNLTALVRTHDDARRPELLEGVVQQSLDLTDGEGWLRVLESHTEEIGEIILLAGAVRGRNPADFAAANIDSIAAATWAASQRTPSPPILLISSLAASQPQLSHYAASKHAGELALKAGTAPWTVLRPAAVYGAGDKELAGLFKTIRAGLVPRPGPRDQRLAFIHATDLVAAIATWLSAPGRCIRETYTIDDGNPQGYGWSEIIAAITPARRSLQLPVPHSVLALAGQINVACATLFGYLPMLSPGKARELGYPRWLCDNTTFTRHTGWQPQIILAQGVADYFSAS